MYTKSCCQYVYQQEDRKVFQTGKHTVKGQLNIFLQTQDILSANLIEVNFDNFGI